MERLFSLDAVNRKIPFPWDSFFCLKFFGVQNRISYPNTKRSICSVFFTVQPEMFLSFISHYPSRIPHLPLPIPHSSFLYHPNSHTPFRIVCGNVSMSSQSGHVQTLTGATSRHALSLTEKHLLQTSSTFVKRFAIIIRARPWQWSTCQMPLDFQF